MNTPYDAEWLEADDEARAQAAEYDDDPDHQWPTEEEQQESFWGAVDGGSYNVVFCGLKTDFVPPGFSLEIVECGCVPKRPEGKPWYAHQPGCPVRRQTTQALADEAVRGYDTREPDGE